MKMTGEELIPASRERVWDALNDPEILKQAIPGCESITKTSPTAFEATVVAKVGPVKARFGGNVNLSKLRPPESYVISGQGKGGAAGFAKGEASVNLAKADGGTLLSYDVDAQVGGKLAQIGSRLIDSTARKMANDFFKRFARLAASDIEITSSEATTMKAPRKTSKAKPASTKAAAASARKPAAKTRATAKSKSAPAKSKATATESRSAAAKSTAASKSTDRQTGPTTAPAARPSVASVEAAAAPAPVPPPRRDISDPAPAPATAPAEKSNSWMWIMVAVIVVLAIFYFTRG